MATTSAPLPDRIALHYREGSSDKVYQAAIEPAANGLFIVTFAYGRRGSTLSTGSKTPSPVPYAEARAIYEKLVRSKTAKGYTPSEDGTPYANTDRERQDTGIRCQLLNPADEQQVERLLDSPDVVLQEKFDGRRMLLRKENGTVTAVNRLGLETALPAGMADEAMALPGTFTIDGEAVGEALHVFDLLRCQGQDLVGHPYAERLMLLKALLDSGPRTHLLPVETLRQPDAKRRALERLRAGGAEGVVFKDLRAPCTPGRPASGGSQFKAKFRESASCLVLAVNDRRSVALGLFDGDRLRPCGNVAIPANRPVPGSGAVVEVGYLYAFRQSSSLFQPVYLGERDDIPPPECTIGQLKYKAA